MNETKPMRCAWVGDDPLYHAYHDEEWGVPVHDDRVLFEQLILESAQAGLSWITILRKRESYRAAFGGFAPEKIAAYGSDDVERLMNDAGIVRNRQKIEATIANARAWLALREQQGEGAFAALVWEVVGGRTRVNRWDSVDQVPASTAESKALSKALKAAGFRFVGPTICYAFMQAAGLVNDHTRDCFRFDQIEPSQIKSKR